MTFNHRGFALPLTLVIMLLIVVLAFSLFQISRQQEMVSRFHGEKEKAYHLAAGGIRIAREFLQKGLDFVNTSDPNTYPKVEKAPPEFKEFISWFMPRMNDYTPGAPFEISTPALLDLQSSQPAARLRVTLKLEKSRELFSDGSSAGLQLDRNEVERRIILISEAELTQGTLPSVTSKVIGFSDLIWASVLPSIFGKFVLFVDGFSVSNLNTIKDSYNSLVVAPLNILSGEPANLETKWSPQEASDEIDKRGWIHISPYEFHVLGLSSAGENPKYAEPYDPKERAKKIEDGFLGKQGPEYKFYFRRQPLAQEWGQAPDYFLAQADENLYAKSSNLNFFGSEEHPSPTLIMGKVQRRFIQMQGWTYQADPDDDVFVFPYLNQQSFEHAKEAPKMTKPWPGQVQDNNSYVVWKHFQVLSETKGKSAYDLYKNYMTKTLEIVYNEANLDFVELDNAKSAPVLSPPFKLGEAGAPPPLKRIEDRGNKVDFFREITSGQVTIKNEKGKPIFQNSDLSAFNDLEFLKRKAGSSRKFSDPGSLYNFIKRDTGQYFLGGVVSIKGNLVITQPLVIGPGGGGILLVEKDIEIKDRIEKSPGETLTLLSLEGKIKVSTSKTVEAGLVARKGLVELPYGVDLRGVLAAKKLSLEPGAGAAHRQLLWDPDFDITDSAVYERSFKASITAAWQHFVTGK